MFKTVIRRRFDKFTSDEWDRFVAAVKRMKEYNIHLGNNGTSDNSGGTYQTYLTWHERINSEHATVSFLPWHRAFLWEFEEDLILADIQNGNDGNIAIPYWQWDYHYGGPADSVRGALWTDDYVGGDGDGSDANDISVGQVTTGPFRESEFKVYPGGATGLTRSLANGRLPRNSHVSACQDIEIFDLPPFDQNAPDPQIDSSVESNPNRRMPYRNVLEGFAMTTGSPGLHNRAHGWIGGHMSQVPVAPNDPVFFLNHAYVDKLWADWQLANPQLASQYPSDSDLSPFPRNARGLPRRLGDAMRPWDGNNGTRTWTVQETLNFQRMGETKDANLPPAPFIAFEHGHLYVYDTLLSRPLNFI